MPNIGTVLREEIARLSRKEGRNQFSATKKATAQHRRDIAGLKRQVAQLQRQVTQLGLHIAVTHWPIIKGHQSIVLLTKDAALSVGADSLRPTSNVAGF